MDQGPILATAFFQAQQMMESGERYPDHCKAAGFMIRRLFEVADRMGVDLDYWTKRGLGLYDGYLPAKIITVHMGCERMM